MTERHLGGLDPELAGTIEQAAEFHGHLGPFLVLGIRMGMRGLEKVKAKKGEKELLITARCKDSTPFSCVLDGLQVVTGRTIGNGGLRVVNSARIAADFKFRGREVEVEVSPDLLRSLGERLFAETAGEMGDLARVVATLSDEKLFRRV